VDGAISSTELLLIPVIEIVHGNGEKTVTVVTLKKLFSCCTLKGRSHEKVGEMSVWGISLGTN
jgi:hypothetical protein